MISDYLWNCVNWTTAGLSSAARQVAVKLTRKRHIPSQINLKHPSNLSCFTKTDSSEINPKLPCFDTSSRRRSLELGSRNRISTSGAIAFNASTLWSSWIIHIHKHFKWIRLCCRTYDNKITLVGWMNYAARRAQYTYLPFGRYSLTFKRGQESKQESKQRLPGFRSSGWLV